MITINFASRNYRLVGRIRIGLIAGSLTLAVMAAAMLWSAVSLHAYRSSLERTLRQLEASDEEARPILAERDQLMKDLTNMSALLESKKISWTRILTNIETVVPKGVALKAVEFKTKDSTLLLSGMAQSPEALRNLVVAMERAAPFKDPFLKHQSLEKGSISFNVVAVYRDGNGNTVAQGKQ